MTQLRVMVLQKARRAIKCIILTAMLPTALSGQVKRENDSLVLNLAIDNLRHIEDTVYIDLSNDNKQVYAIIHKFDYYRKDRVKLDSLRKACHITDNLFRELFSKESENISPENGKKIWDVGESRTWKYAMNGERLQVFVSKPVYLQNERFCILEVREPTLHYFQVFEKINDVWVQRGVMSPKLVSPKVKFQPKP